MPGWAADPPDPAGSSSARPPAGRAARPPTPVPAAAPPPPPQPVRARHAPRRAELHVLRRLSRRQLSPHTSPTTTAAPLLTTRPDRPDDESLASPGDDHPRTRGLLGDPHRGHHARAVGALGAARLHTVPGVSCCGEEPVPRGGR